MGMEQNITVRLSAFEGPLDLLCHLIEKNEIDIYDIPIAEITEQYIVYLDAADTRDMENMSEFLLMAATLIELKSRLLLPRNKPEESEEEIDPREELVKKLIEYKKFKEVTEELKSREEKASLLLYKEADKSIQKLKTANTEDLDEFLKGVTLNDIFKAFEEVMRRKELKVDRVRSGFNSVERDRYTIGDKIRYITDLLTLQPKLYFSAIFRDEAKKMEIVVTFLALLELIKMKQVIIMQEQNFDEIVIMNNGSDQHENNRIRGSD